MIQQPISNEWLAAVDFGGTDGQDPWKAATFSKLQFYRVVTAVDGKTVC